MSANEYLKTHKVTLISVIQPIYYKFVSNKTNDDLDCVIDFDALYQELKQDLVVQARPAYIEFYKNGFHPEEFLRFLTVGQEKLMEWKAASQ